MSVCVCVFFCTYYEKMCVQLLGMYVLVKTKIFGAIWYENDSFGMRHIKAWLKYIGHKLETPNVIVSDLFHSKLVVSTTTSDNIYILVVIQVDIPLCRTYLWKQQENEHCICCALDVSDDQSPILAITILPVLSICHYTFSCPKTS